MSSRYGGPRMRIVLGAATALAAASGMVGTTGAGTAAAQPLTRTFGYTCSSPLIGDQPITAEIDADIPDSVTVGAPGKTITVNAVATVGASFTHWLAMAGMKTLEGTVDATAHVAAPQDDFDVTVPFRMDKTSVPASGPFKVTATASAPTPTFSQPGKVTITAGDLTLHLLAKNATGSQWLAADAPCTLNADSSNVVKSFDITRASSGSSAAPGPATGSGSSAASSPATGSAASTPPRTAAGSGPAAPRPTTGSKIAAVPKPTTSQGAGPTKDSATTPGNPNSRASSTTAVTNSTRATPRSTKSTTAGKPSAAGQDTRDLFLLAVGMLVACAAAFCLGTRLKNHRRTGDDTGEQRYIDPEHGLLIEEVKGGRPVVSRHRKDLSAAAPQRRECGGRATSRGSTGRKVTDSGNPLMARRVLHQAGHQGVGVRACGGADLDSQLPGLLQGEDADDVIDKKPSTGYVRQG